MNQTQKYKMPVQRIVLLILAGEAVFVLPFVLARIFRPTFLDLFQLNNFELGTCFSVYGIVAFISYLMGGTLADKFKPRILIAVALFLTAAGGVFMANYPSYNMMKLLFGYWGFTTIFLFWGAMIKATRAWGGTLYQGRAFGFLEGGRGLVAAGLGTIGVLIYSIFVGEEVELNNFEDRKQAFSYVILFTSFMVALIGVLVLFFMKTKTEVVESNEEKENAIEKFKTVLKIPSVWLLMVIIVCAYVGYKLTDVFSLYANEVMLFDEIESSKVGTLLLYIRPIICVGIGLLADKSRTSLWMIVGFFTMLIGGLVFSTGIIDADVNAFFFLSSIVTATGIYAIRTLYFAAMQEGNIPLAITGTAVGVISIVGYTPDIFVGPIMGYLLDNSPGKLGHQHVFIMLSIFAAIGFVTSIIFYVRLNPKQVKV